MLYITYNQETGAVDEIAFSKQSMIPDGKPNLAVTEEAWRAATGKVKKVVNGEFVWNDPLPTLKDYDDAMEAHLLEERTSRGYTTREPSDYAGSSVERWAQDAADWIAHRDAVMLYGLEVQNHYAETGEAPTMEEFKEGLPRIEWSWTAEPGSAEETGECGLGTAEPE